MIPQGTHSWVARLAGILLVLFQCAALAWLERGFGFAIAAGTLSLLSLVNWFRIEPEQVPHWLWFALLGLILLVKHRVAPAVLPDQITFMNTILAYELARFLIFLQVVQLYVRRPTGCPPAWMGAVACASMVFASDVRLSPSTREISMALCLGFAGAFALFCSGQRRRVGRGTPWRGAFVAAILLMGMLAGGGTAAVLRKFDYKFGEWLASQGGTLARRDVAQGFSGRGRLGEIAAWKQHAAEHIALRAYSRRPAGYLRGLVFDHYEMYGWSVTAEHQPLSGELPGTPSPLRAGDRVYRLTPEAPAPRTGLRSVDVWPAAETASRMFTPLEAVYLASDSGVTLTGDGLALRSTESNGPYTAFVAASAAKTELLEMDRTRCLQLPVTLPQTALAPHVVEAMGDATTAAEKIDAVERFFHTNFEYELRSHLPLGQDRVLYFLERRPSAHCEYFASAGALLLRAAGVPARYVTGYVATEWNGAGGYWVARRRDAHAWIEAYDDEAHRWVTVECTPPGGVPQGEQASEWDNWLDAQGQRFQQWRQRVASGGAFGVLTMMIEWLFSLPALVLGVLAAATVWLRTQRKVAGPARIAQSPPAFPLLMRSLRQVDRLAARRGYTRAPSETLSAFARRLRLGDAGENSSLADWYDHYIRVRYGGADIAAATDALAVRAHSLKSSPGIR